MSIAFATYAVEKEDVLNNYLLACSIRDFAGSLSDIPLRIYVSSDLDIQSEVHRFDGLNAIFSTFPAARKDIAYSFKSAAASACEADVQYGNVIWLDRHMLVLNSCADLLLNPLEQFAYRPPHLKLFGASADEPISDMWKTAYRIAGVKEADLFPMYTEVDRQKIWAYFSAGHFSFRAEAGIMKKWDALFNRLADHKEMKPFYDAEYGRYLLIYLHQIALTLTVLTNVNRNMLKPLPLYYTYPTHLHNDIERYFQATQMDNVFTAFYSCHDGLPKMPLSENLASWIEEKVRAFNT